MTGRRVAGPAGTMCVVADRQRDVSLSTVTPSDTEDGSAVSQAPSSAVASPPSPRQERPPASARSDRGTPRCPSPRPQGGSQRSARPGSEPRQPQAPGLRRAEEGCLRAALSALASCFRLGPRRPQSVPRCGRADRAGHTAIVDSLRLVLAESARGRASAGVGALLLRQDPSRSVDKSYTLVRALGTGSFGSVREVRSVATGEHRALKMLDKAPSVNAALDLRTELEVLLHLDHPHVVKLCEFFEHRRFLYIVTELCEGGDFSLLMRQPCPRQELRLLFRDITAGVAYCHGRGVAHRDIKLANCLLASGATRRVGKVIDFGLSAISRGEPQELLAQGRCGTYLFMAPEILGGRPYGPKCDVWSIGVMLFMILTGGEHPFAADPARCDLRRLLADTRRCPVRADALAAAARDTRAVDLARGLLAREPAERLDAAAALGAPWLCAPEAATEEGRCRLEAQAHELLRRLLSFAELRPLDRALLAVAAQRAAAAVADSSRAVFLALDRRFAGALSQEDLAAGLAARRLDVPAKELDRIFACVDIDGSGRVEWPEWLAATLPPEALQCAGAAREVFDLVGPGGDERISEGELRSALFADAPPEEEPRLFDFDGFSRLVREAARPRGAETCRRQPRSNARRSSGRARP